MKLHDGWLFIYFFCFFFLNNQLISTPLCPSSPAWTDCYISRAASSPGAFALRGLQQGPTLCFSAKVSAVSWKALTSPAVNPQHSGPTSLIWKRIRMMQVIRLYCIWSTTPSAGAWLLYPSPMVLGNTVPPPPQSPSICSIYAQGKIASQRYIFRRHFTCKSSAVFLRALQKRSAPYIY